MYLHVLFSFDLCEFDRPRALSRMIKTATPSKKPVATNCVKAAKITPNNFLIVATNDPSNFIVTICSYIPFFSMILMPIVLANFIITQIQLDLTTELTDQTSFLSIVNDWRKEAQIPLDVCPRDACQVRFSSSSLQGDHRKAVT